MKEIGFLLIIVGIFVIIAGLVFILGENLNWLGKLPGDIRIIRPGFRVYFPLTTCILISIIISLIFYLFK
ncbi:MAG: DUF2905 domain-containing protein [Deltaproteobacteria bacterium]|nr:DUF2905 domain-containing protein [Deltaproteobacteria bacterium]